MQHGTISLLMAVSAFGLAAVPLVADERGTVIRVLEDCRLVTRVGDEEVKVRMIGVECPVESIFLVKYLVEGKQVILRGEAGGRARDEDGALLRDVHRDDGAFINAEIIKRGYGRLSGRHPSPHSGQFLTLEREARKSRAGLWSWGEGLFAPDSPSISQEPAPETGDEANPSTSSQGEPFFAGVGGVTNPEIIPGTKVSPKYPEAARKAGVRGQVILQAVIRKDGTVGQLKVMRSPSGQYGFAAAATAAVKKWRYKPGTKDGKPVDVYFTVVIDFIIKR